MSNTAWSSLVLFTLIGSMPEPASAADPVPEVLRLWDGEAPHAGGAEAIDIPTLHLYRVRAEDKTPGVIIYPGGGYGTLAMDHEGAQMAAWFNSFGISAGVCVYRHRGGGGNGGKGYGHPVPLLDAQRAQRTMRANAAQWNIDPDRIGIIGFSAGGHLASTVSTHHDSGKPDSADRVEQVSSRPDFAILCYPVIALDKPFTHRGSQKNLLGENADPALVASLSNESRVDANTPPTFLFHTAEDKAVSSEHSVVYYLALQRAGVPAEMHIFEKGRHGIGLGADVPGANAWPELCKSWLKVHQVIP